MKPVGPMGNLILPGMAKVLAAAVGLATVGTLCSVWVGDELPWIAAFFCVVSGALLGVALTAASWASTKDEEIHREARRAAALSIDKESFGGWRKH